MRDGPDIARIASLVGDPARANMLTALVGGVSLTASELALEAGVGLPTASSHLAKLSDGGLVRVSSQGRHRYYGLANSQVASMLESIMGVASTSGPKRTRPGPKDESMREARVCYDHLAGRYAVEMFDSFVRRDILRVDEETITLGENSARFFDSVEIGVRDLQQHRRPTCRACLDWSVRRTHLAGTLGAAILQKIIAEKWARREDGSRVIRFSPTGRQNFEKHFLAA